MAAWNNNQKEEDFWIVDIVDSYTGVHAPWQETGVSKPSLALGAYILRVENVRVLIEDW